MTEKTDPAALAERLEQLYKRCELFPERTGEGNIALLELRNLTPEVAAALRQRPQEERPYQKIGESMGLSENLIVAPEERPDLIALAQLAKFNRSLKFNMPDGRSVAVGPLLDRVLSALRAQPASKEQT